MNQQEILKKNMKEILRQDTAERYIQMYRELREQKRKKDGVRWFGGAIIVGILGIIICIWQRFNVYFAYLMLAELIFLASILQIILKKENQKLLNSIKPYGIRKLIFIERMDEKKSVLEYFFAENEEIKKIVEDNILSLDQVKEGEYATLVELGENSRFISKDTDWAIW